MSLPGILRRLFDNDGYGPKLRREIVPLDDLDTFRQSFIGAPRWCRSTILPPHHVWADGSLVLFEDWPEFAEIVYTIGLNGMIMSHEATAEQRAQYPAKWVGHPENIGLYTPRLGGWFMRNWTPGQTKDANRNSGSAQAATQIGSRDTYQAVVGGNYFGGPPLTNYEEQVAASTTQGFGVSASVSGATNLEYSLNAVRPANLAQPVCIYLGNPASTEGDE